MSQREPDYTTLSKAEQEMLKLIADRDGITEDEAATRLVQQAIARRVKKRTGKTPAKIYTMTKKKKEEK